MTRFIAVMASVMVLVVAGGAVATPGQTLTLGPRFDKGQLDDVELVWAWQVTKLTTKENDEQPAFTRSGGRKVWGFVQKVDHVDAHGAARITLTLQRAAISIDAPEGRADYDSAARERLR